MALLPDILAEVHLRCAAEIHPKILALVLAFLAYLKEPRYQNPLTLAELSSLFSAFYVDLNALAIYIYTQLNTNKRLLLQKSAVFSAHPDHYDYLNAIANYSASSIKLVRRSDPLALYQLRVFAFYKFLTIVDSIEKAQTDLFAASTLKDDPSLYDKIFRFDERDIAIQALLSEKFRILRALSLPLSCFCDSLSRQESQRLDEFFLTMESTHTAHLRNIQTTFCLLNEARTPATKLKYLVKVQKLLIVLLLSLYNNDPSKVNNDILLPALIYVIIYHPLSGDSGEEAPDYDLFLNFNFVKNFLNMVDPLSVDPSTCTLSTSLSSYNPAEKRRSFARADRALSSNLYELLNLHESEAKVDDPPVTEMKEFTCDRALINHIQTTYLNNGELQYYLTNFEAILYFLLNTSIKELVPEDFTIPEAHVDNPLITMSLHQVLEKNEQAAAAEVTEELTETLSPEEVEKRFNEELGPNRSRSGSLFNTISSAVSHSVNRSRSNSQPFKAGVALNSELFPHTKDFEASLSTNVSNADAYGLTKVRNLLGRIGLVSNILLRPTPEIDPIDGEEVPEVDRTTLPDTLARGKRSTSLFDKLTPIHSRTRSGSLETAIQGPNSNSRKPTLTSKLSSGVTEFMTKLSTATSASATTTTAPANATLPVLLQRSQSSLHSYDENSPFEDQGMREPELGKRSSSLQTMDRWFNNITGEVVSANDATHRASNSIASNQITSGESNGSVFSTSFGELTKYQHVDFDALTIKDLKALKCYYDQLCTEIMSSKTDSKTSNEYLLEEVDPSKDQTSI